MTDIEHQEQVVERACNEIHPFASLHFDQLLMVRNYLHMVYQIGYMRGKRTNGMNKKVAQVRKGEVLVVYRSLSEAARRTGLGLKAISKVVTGVNNSAGGYFWKYVE